MVLMAIIGLPCPAARLISAGCSAPLGCPPHLLQAHRAALARLPPPCCRRTQLPEEVRAELLAELSERYTPQAYSLFSNNCNK